MSYYNRGGDRGDYRDRRSNYGGSFDDRSGRGRGGRGGGRGGRGGRGFDNSPRPTECTVAMNYHRLAVVDPSRRVDIVVYRVAIEDAVFGPELDESGEPQRDSDTGRARRVFQVRPSADRQEDDNNDDNKDSRRKERFFKSPKPWRVIKKLVKEQRLNNPSFVLDYNGSEMAIAPQGYGPSDGATFQVKIKRDCEEDDPDAEKVRNSWFQVAVKKTHTIPFSDLMDAINGVNSKALNQDLPMIFNVMLKSIAVHSGMIPLDTASSTLIFPLTQQMNLFKSSIPDADFGKKFLLSGVKQTAIFSQGAAYVQTDPIVRWFDKERYQINAPDKVPILDKKNISIAGVKIRDIHSKITDSYQQSDIEKVLSKLCLNVHYEIRKTDPKREEEDRKRGRTQQEIEESRRRVLKNQFIQNDKEQNSKIIWSAYDHTFENDGKMTNVAEYFSERYGIQLQFPNMPIIHFHKKGWFPIEFAYQSFAKTRDANTEEMVSAVLQHYDRIAGKDLIGDVSHKRNTLSDISYGGVRFRDRLSAYNLSIVNEPALLKAKVLVPPKIIFDGTVAPCTNGSFNLRGMRFADPAEVNSFAIVSFTRDRDRNSCREFVDVQLKVARENHGMKIPEATMYIAKSFDAITEFYNGSHPVDDAPEAIRNAVAKARDVYLRDKLGIFRDTRVWFKTIASDNKNQILKCLILPPSRNDSNIGLMFDYDIPGLFFTHEIEMKTGKKYLARLMVRIEETDKLLDPFEFRFENGRHQGQKRDSWADCHFAGFCYECRVGDEDSMIVDEREVVSYQYLHLEKDWKVDCPAIIFAVLPDKGKALYDRIKHVSHTCGIQTQCCAIDNFNKQKNKDQYASNIATKMNTKMSTSLDKAFSWRSSLAGGNDAGVVWVGECPTLVIGIGMAHGLGSNADTVVTASVCLDPECMRLSHSCYLQKRADTINKFTMMDIIMNSWDHYVKENQDPLRLLIYRDGMSDGNFSKATEEIAFVREALKIKMNSVNCDCNYGCPLCNIPITFVICQSQHNVRMVPSNESDGFRVRSGGVNVHSGTVVDHTIMELETLHHITDEDVASIQSLGDSRKVVFNAPSALSNDFFLTAQGGLKGTSKPIYFRVILNENAIWGPSNATALTLENIENCTHHMCYKYGSATKAVREVPVIKYAKKLSNQVLSSLKYLREETHWNGTKLSLIYPHDIEEDNDNRPYIEVVNEEGVHLEGEGKHNIVGMNFHQHLAA